jgi:hypothetical protein
VSFHFPNTDALFAPAADLRTLSGPATIAVTPSASPLPCGLVSTHVLRHERVLACIDDLFAADGTCQPNVDPVFGHFTALPIPNDFQRPASVPRRPAPRSRRRPASYSMPPATSAAHQLVRCPGQLGRRAGARLIRGTIQSPLPFSVPAKVFLGSFTPEGARLPPIFEPQGSPATRETW